MDWLLRTLSGALRATGGQIGYVVVPEFRRQRHATAMLGRALGVTRERQGLGRVLVTCNDDNVDSIRPTRLRETASRLAPERGP